MAKRPYISLLTKDLLRLFEENQNDKKILTELKKELVHRNKEKAVKLLARVEARLSELGGEKSMPPDSSEQLILPGVELPKHPKTKSKPCQNSSKPQETSSKQQEEKVCISVTLPKLPWNKTKIWDFLSKTFKRK